MKTIIATLVFSVALAAVPSLAGAQSFAADTAGIEAFSDTTSTSAAVDTAYASAPMPMQTNVSIDGFGDAFDMFAHAFSDALLPFVVFLILLFVLPIAVIALLIYLIYKTSRQRRRINELTSNGSGQSPAAAATPVQRDGRSLWGCGVMNAAVGVGLFFLFLLLDISIGMGLACVVACYGIGQMVLARTGDRGKRQ